MTDADNQPDIMSLSSPWLMLITNQTLLMIDADNQPDIMSNPWLMLITSQTLCLCQTHDVMTDADNQPDITHDWCW